MKEGAADYLAKPWDNARLVTTVRNLLQLHTAMAAERERLARVDRSHAELAARISEELFYDLEAPVLRATGFDTPYPPARLEKVWLPGVDRLMDCVEKTLRRP